MRYTIDAPELDLSRLEGDGVRAVGEALKAGVDMIVNDMKRAVANGPKTGHVYKFFFRTNKQTGGVYPVEERPVPHQASAPGEAPATDTGRLISSIAGEAAYNTQSRQFTAAIRVNVEYAQFLEYGTRKIAPRPFMLPAIEFNRPRIFEMMREALDQEAAQFARNGIFTTGSFAGGIPGSEVGTEFESRYWAFKFSDDKFGAGWW